MKKISFIAFLAGLTACQNKIESGEQVSYRNLEQEQTYVDSILTDTILPLIPRDTFPYVNTGWSEITPERTKLKTKNYYQIQDSLIFKLPPTEAKIIIPDTLHVQTFYDVLNHPEPQRAGELRSTSAARENIRYLDVGQGLASPNVYSIAEDNDGILWFGTSNGLTRYDGTYLINYTKDNGLPSNLIQEIFIDSKNQMWLSTSKGVVVYDGTSLKIYTKKGGLPGNDCGSFCEDKDGNIWFISEGVVRYDGKNFYHYNSSNGLSSSGPTTLGLMPSGELFVGIFANHPQYLTEDTIKTIIAQEPAEWWYGSNIYIETMIDNANNFWVVNYNATISKTIGDSMNIIYPTQNIGPHHYSIDDIIQDSKGNIWLSSIESGVYKLGPGGLKIYSTVEGLNTNYVTNLFEDSKGNIWIGTAGGGVNVIIPGSFRVYDQADGFTAKTVFSFFLDDHKNLMMSTWADGIYSFDGESIYKHREHIGEIIAFDFQRDYFGDLICGAHQFGIYRFRTSDNDTILYDSLQNWKMIPGIQLWSLRAIEQDAAGNLWLFDEAYGAYRFMLNADKTDYASIEYYPKESGFTTVNIAYSVRENDGSIWITDNNSGMSCIRGNTIEHFTTKNGLISNNVISLFIDSEEALWIGTTEGIQIKKNKEFKIITKSDGLSSNNIRSIKEDQLGRFWIGTNNGLNLLVPDKSKPCEFAITTFSNQDGLATSEFLSNCVELDSNNTLWWGTRRGVISLNLDHFERESFLPQVELTAIKLKDQHVDFVQLKDSMRAGKSISFNETDVTLDGIEFDSLVPYYNYPKEFTLPYSINSITFYFSCSNAVSSHQLRYRYRMLGYQHKWSEESNESMVKYENLPHGKYTFEVQACLHNQPWGESLIYKFEILPPFWKTWWFRTLVFFFILGVLYLIFRWRNRALIQRQHELERTVKERTQEIQEQKTLIEEKQIEILDSINYAQRIQRALLATDEILKKNLPDHFVFFQPKDIVSGDFYWASETDQKQFLLITADSTGHGVPGAIMSMLNISALEKAVESDKLYEPAEVLNAARTKIISTLAKDGSLEGGKDGMDCSLIRFDFNKMEISFSGANNGIWIFRNGTMLEFEPDRMPVGKHLRDKIPFNQIEIPILKGDLIYMFTDGFADQFGGDKGKKFKYKSLKNVLVENATYSMSEQGQKLGKILADWKGELEQVDDICIIGIKI